MLKKTEEQPKHQRDHSSRSNSIQGRKLSFCDAQLTISQNTLESNGIHDYQIDVEVVYTHREKESIQRLSSAGFHLQNLHQGCRPPQQDHYQSFVVNQSHSESLIISQAKNSIKQVKSLAIGRGQNPRQSKEPAKKKQRKQTQINQVKIQNFNRPSSKINQNSQSKYSNHNNSVNTSLVARSPLKERKPNQQQCTPYLHPQNKPGKNSKHPTSFMLTFNRDKVTPDKPLPVADQILNLSKLNLSREDRIKRLDEEGEKIKQQILQSSSGKKRQENRRSHSTSPFKQGKNHSQSTYLPDRYSEIPSRLVQREGSPEQRSQSKSIDKIIKENIKKQAVQHKEQLTKILIDQEKENIRKKQIKVKNTIIRQRNQQNQALKKLQLQHQQQQLDQVNLKKVQQHRAIEEGFRMKSKSPLKYFEDKNFDMPLKKEENKKKYDLGLEIFEIKKEMGMLNDKSIEKILTERSKKAKVVRDKVDQQQQYQQQQVQDEKKKISENPQLKKLIKEQKKQWIKKIKKQKIIEIMSQQRVLSNLKQLNQVIDQRLSIKKKPKDVHNKSIFKTVEDYEQLYLQNNKQTNKSALGISKPHRSKSKHTITYSPETIYKKKFNILQQKDSISARRSENPINKMSVKVPKANVIYSYVSNEKSLKVKNGQQKLTKQMLIKKIMKQLEKQKVQQESFREQQRSRSRSKSQRRKSTSQNKSSFRNKQISIDSPNKFPNHRRESVKQDSTLSQVSQPNRYIQPEHMINQPTVDNSVESDNILIDDEMMIFCVLTTAASIIQKHFRGYILRKKLKLNKQVKDEYSQLSESIKFENRIIPSQQPKQEALPTISEEERRRKTPKHTFSFGNYDEQHQISQGMPLQHSLLDNKNKAQHQRSHAPDNGSFRLDTSPIESDQPSFFNHPLKSNDYEQVQKLQQPQSRQQELPQQQANTNTLEKVLNINDKFKYALRNIAEKQKQMNIFDHLKQKPAKSDLRSELEALIEQKETRHFISGGDTSDDQMELESIRQSPKELSKVSLNIEDEQIEVVRQESRVNNESMLSSLLASKGEQTDKIILYSPINTNEEILVNESNTVNEESIIINESNINYSRIDESLPAITSEGKDKQPNDNNESDSLIQMEESKDDNFITDQPHHTNDLHKDKLFDYIQDDHQHLTNRSQNKHFLRLMFGDEKFLQDHDYDFPSLTGSPNDGSQSNRVSENPFFLATNASIFERNPFKEFTTNKLHEVLGNKNYLEIVKLKDDALKFQEKLEHGFLNRLEKHDEISPRSVQRRKYELEKWVTYERQKDSKSDSTPINMFDLDEERLEAIKIIDQANKKAREIKDKLQQKPVIEVVDVDEPQSVIDLSLEEQKESKVFTMPELPDLPKESQTDQDGPAVVLEISMDEDEDYEELRQLQEKSFANHDSQTSQNKDLQIEELTQQIFQDFLEKELLNIKLLREAQPAIDTLPDSPYEDRPFELKPIVNDKFVNERLIKPQLILETTVKDMTTQMKRSGIDTTDELIDRYIDEVFMQIKPRKEQFLQAFITPIFKNPVEILGNLQKPDYGEMDPGLDFTNSLAYILNVQLYLTLEKARENLIHEAIEQIRKQHLATSSGNLLSEEDLTDLISEAQHIHNKVIFDCVNESLNMVRPYANQGEPMPWSKKPRKNLMFMLESTDNLDQILVHVKNTVLAWAKTKAGALPPKFFSTESHFNPQQQQMEEEAFSHQRERCLAQLLASDLIRDEVKWLDYEMEEAQVKIDLSDIVLEHLVGETVDILNQIQQSRK